MRFPAVATALMLFGAPVAALESTNEDSGYFWFDDKRQLISYVIIDRRKTAVKFAIAYITPISSVDKNIPSVPIPSPGIASCGIKSSALDIIHKSYYISNDIKEETFDELMGSVLFDFCNVYRRYWVDWRN